MTQLATITEERRGDVAVGRVAGEIDTSNSGWLAERLGRLVTNRSAGLAIDLSETTYLDSAGIAVLFDLANTLTRHRQELCLVVSETSPIARMISLTGLDAAVPTYPSLEAAFGKR